jgi:tetratricopeptide (TPR) repeat protein
MKSAIAVVGLLAAVPACADPASMSQTMPMPPADSTAGHAGHDQVDHGHGSHDDMLVPRRPTLLAGYGNGGFAITTHVPEAQAFFSNGMELGFAFAHPAAVAAMKEAVRLDPDCAMCKWGEALVDGPTLNYGKDAKERVPLYALAREAQREAARSGTPRERALIGALLARYRPGGKVEQRDDQYAEAMRRVQRRYLEDNEIAVLTVDAIMVAANYADDPDPATMREAMALLQTVLKRAPDHTPAIHFYIHATEAAGEPRLAEPYADRLPALAPNASHLQHMPSHTFYWVGRYQDAADANRRAVEIGLAQAKALGVDAPEGVWGLPYHAHNVIFGIGGAIMAGDSRTALFLARPLVERAATKADSEPIDQLLAASGYFAFARFDPVATLTLAEPKLSYLRAAWHYARGEAFAWMGDTAALKAERAQIPKKIAGGKIDDTSRAPEQMLGIARGVLDGRIAMLEGRYADAEKTFAAAADIEETKDFMRFSDPPAFWYPVRRDVAAAILAEGDKPRAAAAVQASLKLRPKDPVALDLLARTQGARHPVVASGQPLP